LEFLCELYCDARIHGTSNGLAELKTKQNYLYIKQLNCASSIFTEFNP